MSLVSTKPPTVAAALRAAARDVERNLATLPRGEEEHLRLLLSLVDRLLSDACADNLAPFRLAVAAGKLCQAAARAAGGPVEAGWVKPERGIRRQENGMLEIVRLNTFEAEIDFYAVELRETAKFIPGPADRTRLLALAERLECLLRP